MKSMISKFRVSEHLYRFWVGSREKALSSGATIINRRRA